MSANQSRALVRFCLRSNYFIEMMKTPKDAWKLKLIEIFNEEREPNWVIEEILATPRERVIEEILYFSVITGREDTNEIFRLWGGELSEIKYGKYFFLQRVFDCFSKIRIEDSQRDAFRVAIYYYNGELDNYHGDEKISSIIQEWKIRIDVKEPDIFY